MMRKLIGTFIVFLICGLWMSAHGSRYASKSVLSAGTWKKIRIEKTGIYKITYDELEKMGFPDPMKVSVHGYGGWPLDEDFRKPYIDDLPAVAVWRGDGYLLFYAKGVIKWEYDKAKMSFVRTPNPYANEGYYFITDATDTKEMERVPLMTDNAALKIDTFDEYLLHEVERESLNKSGQDLFGEKISKNPATIRMEGVEGMTSDPGKILCRIVAKTFNRNTVILSVNNEDIMGSIAQVSKNEQSLDYIKAKPAEITGSWTGEKLPNFNLNISFDDKSNGTAYLDYVLFQGKRLLKTYTEPFIFFRSIQSIQNSSRFVVQEATENMLVFDVTDGLEPKLMETKLEGKELSFTIGKGELREFALVRTGQSFPVISAKEAETVIPQDLHGEPQPDMVIISPSGLKSEAVRLKEAHEKRDGLRVLVVTPEEIYNEFSSGTPDATAYRRFMKMFFDRSVSEGGNAPRYLLLFGDGAYDNRFLTKEWKQYPEHDRKNMLLTYQTKESLNAYSYVTDSYFGFLHDKEDIFWLDETGDTKSTATVDIGIGRFPVRDLSQATQAVDKVISYMNNTNRGIWKNNICFLADDGSSSDKFSTIHQIQTDAMANRVEKNNPEYIVNKIYFDAYKKTTSGHNPYPGVRDALQRKLKDGVLVLNYVGHGGTEALSDERVITQNDILQAKYPCLPLWITATCDFTRFDDVSTSAGEDVFLNPESGGIGLFTTFRVSFVSINGPINSSLIQHLFLDGDSKTLALGDVIRKTISSSQNGKKLGFGLIGDPALRLSYPEYNITLTSINGKQVDGGVVQLKAFDRVTLEGEIRDSEGTPATGFNGRLDVKVLDGKKTITTLANNTYKNKMSYEDYPNMIYLGNCLVQDGAFNLSFIVPKDISYSTDNCGKMSFYASDEVTGKEAQGYFRDFVAGGTAGNLEKDTVPPEIRLLFLNDTAFKDGGKVNTTPYFYARLWDKSGINITGNSPGHDITLYIDDDPGRNYNLNSYYENGADGEGAVMFGIPELEPGLHFAEFKVWDIMNNARTDTFTFEVQDRLKPFISNLTATPNPAHGHVQFRFSHNRPECRMAVGIMVYDLAGRLLWKHEEQGTSGLFQDYRIDWDCSVSGGSTLRSGIYIYRAAIRTDNSKEATGAKKLIILSE